MVINLLSGEYSTSQKALFERFTALQTENGRSTLRAMAAIAKAVSAIHLRWLPHVAVASRVTNMNRCKPLLFFV